jgi:hypothetical protein
MVVTKRSNNHRRKAAKACVRDVMVAFEHVHKLGYLAGMLDEMSGKATITNFEVVARREFLKIANTKFVVTKIAELATPKT